MRWNLTLRLSSIWSIVVVGPAVAQLGLSIWAADRWVARSELTLFWVVVIAASLCAVTSAMMMRRAWRTGEAELGFTGAFFYAVSVLPLAHGITTPGVLFGENGASSLAVLLAIPAGLVAPLPLLAPRVRAAFPRRHWRRWVMISCAASTAVAVAMIAGARAINAPDPGSPLVRSIALVSFIGCASLSWRHLQLARIARRSGPLVVSAGYGFVGATAFVWFGAAPYSAGFWVAHLLDIIGVFLATIAGVVVYRRTDSVHDVVESVIVAEPLGALEVGLEPIVHDFVADLEAKDRTTRDHVIRTARIAITVGRQLGLDAEDLRCLGLAAILHDVGKLTIPDDLLNKPDRLSDAEYEIIKTHAAAGARLVATSPVLAPIAPLVRSHHERVDGRGYPDGHEGPAIPYLARIVAVCDAYDAMANTRQYREGMGHDRAVSILLEHAGSQWDAPIVDAVVAALETTPSEELTALESVGRIGCDCLPEGLQDELLAPVATG